MAPRRGEVVEERRDVEAMELGEKISAMEEKFSTLETSMEGRLGTIEEMLRQLVEAQVRIQNSAEKGKGPNPNPNFLIIQERGEEALEGGTPHPQIHSGETLGLPTATGGGGFGSQGGGPNDRAPQLDMP